MAVTATPADNGQVLQLGGNETSAERSRKLAASLVNTHFFPPGFTTVRLMALEATAYHNLRPYPYFHFADWKTEERGPMPRCLPLARRIINKSAKWLFNRPIQLTAPNNAKLEETFRGYWQRNQMPTRMVTGAQAGGQQGGVVLKWSYDETADPKLSFQILSTIHHCRLFYDPHNANKLLMARVQYPVFNPSDGQTYIYREEWTDEEEVHYPLLLAKEYPLYRGGLDQVPIAMVPFVASNQMEPDLYQDWEPVRRRNPFGIIPCWEIRNADTGGTHGAGDLWTDAGGGMYRVIDRINLCWHLQDKSNQFDTERNLIFLDVNAGRDQIDQRLAPGQPASLKSDPSPDGKGGNGQVIQLEAGGQMREHMVTYCMELKREILDTVGSVDIREDEITNKGNLTTAVLTQLYAPLIDTTEGKRKTYGEDGICKFLERCAVGLKNAKINEPGISAVKVDNEDGYDIQIKWPAYFEESEDEKTIRVTRIVSELNEGLNTHERVVEEVAKTEDIEDLQAFKAELGDAEKRRTRMADATVETAEAEAKAAADPMAGVGKAFRSGGGAAK